MTRDAGQVPARHALAGAAIVMGILALVIMGLSALLRPAERVAELDAPADATAAACPTVGIGDGHETPVTVTAELLLECPRELDDRVVRYTGEVVRGILRRGDRAWVQLNDDPYGLLIGPVPETRTSVGGNSGIPVSIPAAAADEISLVGNHRARGDLLDVRGVFRRADPADDGGPMIQADAVRIIRQGYPIHRQSSPARPWVAFGATLVAGLTALGASRAHR